MKILIISLPRCGSTNLMLTISKENKLKPIFEPFDGSQREIYEKKMKNIIVKTIVGHQINKDVEHIIFLNNLIKEFDKTILLSRIDLLACAQSHAYVVYNKNRQNFSSVSEYYWQSTPIDGVCYDNILEWNNILESLSKLSGIPITYYENIYDINSKSRLRKGNQKDLEKKLI